MTDTYYKGLYRELVITLYDLALDVLNNAGIEDEREFYLDPYLEQIKVYNPLPAVKHSEALQIITNAGRCALFGCRKAWSVSCPARQISLVHEPAQKNGFLQEESRFQKTNFSSRIRKQGHPE